MSDGSLNNCIDSLEMKLAFLEESLETLSQEFYAQQRQVDALQRHQASFLDKLKNLDANIEAENVADEKPPHY